MPKPAAASPRPCAAAAARLMRQSDLVERVLAYDPDADEALLNKAYVYAMTAHGKQFRASAIPISPIRWKWRPSSPTSSWMCPPS
jgi:hypothetical protein